VMAASSGNLSAKSDEERLSFVNPYQLVLCQN
jgi:hypothetical protein